MIAELTLENPRENHSVSSICKRFIDEKLIEYQNEENKLNNITKEFLE